MDADYFNLCPSISHGVWCWFRFQGISIEVVGKLGENADAVSQASLL